MAALAALLTCARVLAMAALCGLALVGIAAGLVQASGREIPDSVELMGVVWPAATALSFAAICVVTF